MHPKRAMWIRTIIAAALLGCAPVAAWAAEPILEQPADTRGYAGYPIDLAYSLRWDGAPDHYVVFPARLDTVEGVETAVIESSVRREDGQAVATQVVRVVPEEPGTVTVPEVTVRYAAAEDVRAGNAAPKAVSADPVTLQVRDYAFVKRVWLGGGVAAVVFVVLVILGLVWRRRRRRRNAAVAALSPAERARDVLHAARRHRLDGDFYAYYRALAEAARMLGAAGAPLVERLEQRTRAVGYQGMQPTEDALNGDLKDVERALARAQSASAGAP
ncbi:MAG: hypothetical protein ACLFTT_02995 [Candidatus Hydrogenedentota bacterium]